ncbi:MAG: hypothetical protein HW421_2623 [Ignavibacteria bacterium]|nr:hypothetical protein [Ignavibacteria bacterium]
MNLINKPTIQIVNDAVMLLNKELGTTQSLIFFSQFYNSSGDYTKDRQDILDSFNIEEYRQFCIKSKTK